MLDRDTIIYGAQLAFLDLAEQIYDKQVEGDDYDCLEDKFILVHNYLLILQNSPGLDREELILECLTKQLNLFDLPIAPSVGMKTKPTIIIGGRPTEVVEGPAGRDGTNANITVEGEGGYVNVREEGDSTSKTYFVSMLPYVAPLGSINAKASVDNRKVFEVGESVDIQIVVDTIEGSSDITTRELYANGVALGLQELSGEELILDDEVQTDTTYTLEISDDQNQILLEDSVSFFYPYIYGSGDSIDYSSSKIIADKGNQSIVFNGNYTKFHFGFITEYGSLVKILDQHDDDVTSSFEVNEVSISSSGHGALDWTKTYKIYSTIDKTDISNQTYKFIFNAI